MEREDNVLVWMADRLPERLLDRENIVEVTNRFMKEPISHTAHVWERWAINMPDDAAIKEYLEEEEEDYSKIRRSPCPPRVGRTIAIKADFNGEHNGEHVIGERLSAEWGPADDDMCRPEYYGLSKTPIVFGPKHWFITLAHLTCHGISWRRVIKSNEKHPLPGEVRYSNILQEVTEDGWDSITKFGYLSEDMFDITVVNKNNIDFIMKLLEFSDNITERFNSPYECLRLDREAIIEKAFLSVLLQKYHQHPYYYGREKQAEFKAAWGIGGVVTEKDAPISPVTASKEKSNRSSTTLFD